MTAFITLPGFPIRISPGHSSFDNSPELFAAYYVLLRLSTPRHPPSALHSLISIPLLQSLRASKKLKISSDSLESSIQTLDSNLSKSLDLLALILYHFLLFCFQRDVPWNVFTKTLLYKDLFYFPFLRFFASPIEPNIKSYPTGEAGLYADRINVSRFFSKKNVTKFFHCHNCAK